MEEALCLADPVLEDVYQYWPPPLNLALRIPPLLWARLKHDIADFIMFSFLFGPGDGLAEASIQDAGGVHDEPLPQPVQEGHPRALSSECGRSQGLPRRPHPVLHRRVRRSAQGPSFSFFQKPNGK